jgi:hypothetical protein
MKVHTTVFFVFFWASSAYDSCGAIFCLPQKAQIRQKAHQPRTPKVQIDHPLPHAGQMLRSLAAAARWPAAAARRRLLHLGKGVGGGEEVESVAYRMSMLRAPPVVRKSAIISPNSCSLIGRLDAPVRPYRDSSEDEPRAYTFLSVTPSSSSSSSSYSFRLSRPPVVPIPPPPKGWCFLFFSR